MNKQPQFYIVNTTDRPDRKHVVQLVDKDKKTVEYISEELRNWGQLTLTSRSTNVKDFGFDIKVKSGIAIFTRSGPSKARYPDGSHRSWQGAQEFRLKTASAKECIESEDNTKPAVESKELIDEANKVIAELTILNSRLQTKVKNLLNANSYINSVINGIGGPLNDNKLGYNADQLSVFREIMDVIEVAEYEQ